MTKSFTLLNFDGVLQSGVHGIRDLDIICSQALGMMGGASPFQLSELTISKTSIFRPEEVGDIVFLPPVFMTPELVEFFLGELDYVVNWLKQLCGRKNIQICGCCASVLLLAEAGLLDKRQATTTWWMLKELELRYPNIQTQSNEMLVESGNIITSSGPFSFVSQFLYLVEDTVGTEASRLLAKLAVVEPGKPANGVFAVPNLFTNKDPWLLRVQEIVIQNLSGGIAVSDVASALNLSERTLHRRVKEKTGVSPRELISGIKVEVAKTMLETSSDPIVTIGTAVGFLDDSSFRSAFTKAVGITPKAYRSRMNPESEVHS